MAIYVCEVCGELVDDDWNPGEEYKYGLICPPCLENQSEGVNDMELPERLIDLEVDVSNKLKACMKRPIQILATQMDTEFRVKTLEGDYKQGKPGDYLMCGIEGELYICDKRIFEKSYDWIIE